MTANLTTATPAQLADLEVSTWTASHALFMEVSEGATVVASPADRRRVARLEGKWTAVLAEMEARGLMVDTRRH